MNNILCNIIGEYFKLLHKFFFLKIKIKIKIKLKIYLVISQSRQFLWACGKSFWTALAVDRPERYWYTYSIAPHVWGSEWRDWTSRLKAYCAVKRADRHYKWLFFAERDIAVRFRVGGNNSNQETFRQDFLAGRHRYLYTGGWNIWVEFF